MSEEAGDSGVQHQMSAKWRAVRLRLRWLRANVRWLFADPARRPGAIALARKNETLRAELARQSAKIDVLKEEAARQSQSKATLKAKLSGTAARGEAATLPRYQYGSYTPGVEGWRERWEARPGKRVLLYAKKDYSGSFMGWATAINEFTDYAARLVVLGAHAYGYPVDLLFLPSALADSDFLRLRDEADLIHIKDETGFFDGNNRLPPDIFTATGKPMVFTHYGGYARKGQLDERYHHFVGTFDARIVMTPDLNYPWFEGEFIPHAVDVRKYPFSWRDGNVVSHSPSTRGRKGTTEFLEAIEALESRGIALDLIENVSHAECVARKSRATLFFDQAGKERVESLGIDTIVGWYGNSALEAAAYGIPTIAHLSEEAFAGAERAGRDVRETCRILNTPLGVEGIRTTITRFFELPLDEREAISHATREWVDSFHSYAAVGAQLQRVYTSLLATGAGTEGPSLSSLEIG